MANLVVEAFQSALPLRRCSTRLGKTFVAPAGATPCAAAQMGVAACPCAGAAERRAYDDAVAVAAEAMAGTTGRIASGSPTACGRSPRRSASRRLRWRATACRRWRAP
jgi:DNA polymerase-3 subunit epsilon